MRAPFPVGRFPLRKGWRSERETGNGKRSSGDHHPRRPRHPGPGRQEPVAGDPRGRRRSALFLLAPGAGRGRRLPPVRDHQVPGRQGRTRPRRHGLHDAVQRRTSDHRQRRILGGDAKGGDRVPDDQPPARLPGLRGRRRVPPAGHDDHGRPRLPPLPRPQTHAPQPGAGPVHRSRDEPLHRLLPLRAFLQGLRRRHRSRRVRRPQPRLLRPRGGRHAGIAVCRQPGRGLPHRRVHRQAAFAALHAQVGPAVGAGHLRALRGRLQHAAGRTLRTAEARLEPLPRRAQRLLPL